MKTAGWLLGLVALGGLIVLSVAGLNAAIGILVTAAALVGMIALGNLLGGRTTPNRAPYPPASEAGGDVQRTEVEKSGTSEDQLRNAEGEGTAT